MSWDPSIEDEQSGNNEMLANTRLHVVEMEVETGGSSVSNRW